MKKLVLLLSAILSCSCASSMKKPLSYEETAQKVSVKDAAIQCSPPNSMCWPELAALLPLEILSTNKETITVECNYASKIDDPYRKMCTQRIEKMAQAFSNKWASSLSPISLDLVQYKENHVCIDSYMPGQEMADCNFYYISAIIPLHWLNR